MCPVYPSARRARAVRTPPTDDPTMTTLCRTVTPMNKRGSWQRGLDEPWTTALALAYKIVCINVGASKMPALPEPLGSEPATQTTDDARPGHVVRAAISDGSFST